MAIAWAITITKKTTYGDQQIVFATLVSPASGSNTYTTGGDTVTPASLGLAYIDYADMGPAIASGGGATAYLVNFTPGSGENVAGKLQLYTSNGAAPAALAEETSSTAVASFTVLAEFRGV